MCRRCYPTPIFFREVSPGVLGSRPTAPGAAELLRGWPGRGWSRGWGQPGTQGEARAGGWGLREHRSLESGIVKGQPGAGFKSPTDGCCGRQEASLSACGRHAPRGRAPAPTLARGPRVPGREGRGASERAGGPCGPSPRGAGSGRGRGCGRGAGAASHRPLARPARLSSRPSCCAGTCRAAEVRAARGAAGQAGRAGVGEGELGGFPLPLAARRKLVES